MNEEVYQRLRADFGTEAYMVDRSRGDAVTLIGVKAMYAIERLNEVFGLCGTGWIYDFDEPELHKDNKRIEVVVKLYLQWRVGEGGTHPRSDPNGEKIWSEPIISFGGSSSYGRGSTPITDAMKGAVTNAISKAASMIGVAIAAYKGQLKTGDGKEVWVDGELPLSSKLDEMESLIAQALETIRALNPQKLDSLRDYKVVDDFFAQSVLSPLIDYIKAVNLTDFVKDNFATLVGRDIKFGEMTMSEARMVGDIVRSIHDKKITWEQALLIASSIKDRSDSWDEIANSWLAEKAEDPDE